MYIAYCVKKGKVQEIYAMHSDTEVMVEQLLAYGLVVWDDDDGNCSYEQALDALGKAELHPNITQGVKFTKGLRVVFVKLALPTTYARALH